MKLKMSKMASMYTLMQKSNDSVRIEGVHGIGKSESVADWAEEHGYHLEILMLSQQETADLIGMPGDEMIDGTKVMFWSKPAWLYRMEQAHKDGKKCVLFLDELSRAPLEVRQAALQLVLDKRIHEHHLPVHKDGTTTFVVAADNPADKYQTDELDPALLDRFATFEVEVDVKGWLEWANDKDVESVVTDFIAEYPENLHVMFDDSGKDKGATPRSWKKLSDILKNVDLIERNMLIPAIISKVGETIGHSFNLYYNDYLKVVKLEDVLEIIGDAPISSEREQTEMAKVLSETTGQIEAISADQLAQKIKKAIEDEGLDENILTVYLGSLLFEIGLPIFKNWKDKESTADFYYTWAESVPNRWLFTRVTINRAE